MYILTAGTHLGRFVLINLLGKGGMGEVWRAQDPRLGREVAIKVLPPDLAKDPDSRVRFERESKVLAALNDPCIAQIYDHGEEVPILPGSTPGRDRISFLVMELIEGKSLSDILLSGQIPVPTSVRLGRQIARALAVAHRAGIIHRDLKPANIMVTSKNQVKVLDFGLARPFSMVGGPNLPEVTVPGMVMGTAAYLSPEQVKGHSADIRSDIWALGCVIYQMLAGRRPFPSNSVPEILAGILRDEPEDLTELDPGLNPALAAIARKCLEKDPDQRPQSAMEVAGALKEIYSQLRSAVAGDNRQPVARVEEITSTPNPVHIEALNRYLRMINVDYPQLPAKKSGPSFVELIHRGAKIGIVVTSKPKDRYDVVAFVCPVFRYLPDRLENLYKRLLVLSNGQTDIAQFAIDHRTHFVNLTCIRICSHLDSREFQYTLDAMSRVVHRIALPLKNEFGAQ